MTEQNQFPNFEENQQYLLMPEDEPRAVFVDTSFNTHLAVAASPFLTVSHLQRQISLEHFDCFPKFGRIIVKALSVELNGTAYHLPEPMLLKTAFHGSMKAWTVFAEVWKPVGSLGLQKDEFKHVKSSQDHHILEQTKPSPKHDHDHKLGQQVGSLGFQKDEVKQTKPSPKHDQKLGHASPHHQETPKKSSKMDKKNGKRKAVKEINIGVDKQSTVISKRKKKVKTKNGVSKTGSQVQMDHAIAKVQLNDPARNYSQGTGEDSGHKLPQRPCVVHHNTSVVKPSVLPMAGGDNVVKDLQGTSVDFAANSNQNQKTRSRKMRKKKNNIDGINQNSAVNSVNGCAILGKVDAPSENCNIIPKSEQNGIEPGGDLSQSQLNNVQEPLSQQDLLNSEKKIEEDLPLMKSDNASMKRNTCETAQESQKDAQKVSPLHLSNVTELLAQGELLNSNEKEKEIKEDLKLENTAKKRKTKKAKSSNTNLEFSSQKPNDSEKTDVTGNIGNQHSNETLMEMDAPRNVDDSLTRCANDALVKPYDNDEEYCKSADVASSTLLNNALKVMMSEEEPLNLIETEKEIKEDVALLKSKKRKTKKAKNSGMENQDSSSSRQNQDETDGTSLVHVEHSLQNDVGRPEGSVETINETLKSSQNRKKDPCESPVLEQLDEVSREENVPVSSIQSDKPKKRTQKKQPVSGIDLPSLHVDQQLDDKTMKIDAPKRVKTVEQTESCCDDSKHQEKSIQVEGHHDKPSETLPLDGPSGLEDTSVPDKPRASKRKTKKVDPLTSVESGHNLVELKKKRGCEKTPEHQKTISKKSGNNLVESKKKRGCEKTPEHQKTISNNGDLGMEMDDPKRVDDSLTDNKSNDVEYQKAMRQDEEHGELSQAPGLEVSAEMRQLENPRVNKKTKKVDQPSSVDTSTDGHKLVNKGSPKTFELQGSITDQKNNKSTPPPSAKHSTVSKNLMDALVSPGDRINTPRKAGVSCASFDDRSQSSGESSKNAENKAQKQGKRAKAPSDKLEENGAGLKQYSRSASSKVLGASEQKKGGLSTSSAIFDDANSLSSDGENRTNMSNSSTTLPPDDSDGESKGVVISKDDSLKNNGTSKANSSGLKLESILRSSSRYKKAKLVASQSQDDSEPPEFVPDSQADK